MALIKTIEIKLLLHEMSIRTTFMQTVNDKHESITKSGIYWILSGAEGYNYLF